MRLVSDDGKEVIATNDELTSVSAVPQATLRDAQHLNLSFNALTSLQGLHTASHLRNLNVSHNALVSLQGVEMLHNLRVLRCHGNRISDLSWLASLPNLRELWVSDNEVETPQISHLATLRSLETLVLHPNPCTNAVHYVSYVVKTLPWLSRVDRVVVDEPLRQQSQHIDERVFLSSAATDVSEISLMTSRSDVPADLDDNQQAELLPTHEEVVETIAPVEVKPTKKKTKKMTAEDFMRAFPVQEFIPASGEEVIESDSRTSSPPEEHKLPMGLPPMGIASGENQIQDVYTASNVSEIADTGNTEGIVIAKQAEPTHAPSSTGSAISSAVLSLPSFTDDGILQKKKTPTLGNAKLKKATKKNTPSKPVAATASSDPTLASFQQQEWIHTYPNSSVNAIHIRTDGSAVAKWPTGSVAVSIDRERDGYRCYASHKDGTIALSFDADGVGFINYYPSGRMMISTSSSGDGLFFSSEGTILRQWDAQLNMKNEKWEPTDKLSENETDGALITKLSDELGVRFQLSAKKHSDGSSSSSRINLKIFFSSGPGIRHAFCNWINKSEPNPSECDSVFGKAASKLKKKASNMRAHTHVDTLHDIRAAVAKLS